MSYADALWFRDRQTWPSVVRRDGRIQRVLSAQTAALSSDRRHTLYYLFRLANSLPKKLLQKYRSEKEQIEHQYERVVAGLASEEWLDFHSSWFKRFEEVLDEATNGPIWLQHPEVAGIIFDAFLRRDKTEFDLFALCLMANHGHVVLRPKLDLTFIKRSTVDDELKYVTSEATLARIMKSLKGYTARMANRQLGRTGQFWEVESYDHQVRDYAEFFRVVRYTLQNPVKAGLVETWQDWRWTYLKDGLREYFED